MVKLYQAFDVDEETPVQYLAVHPIQWKREWGRPAIMFREVDDETQTLADAAPDLLAVCVKMTNDGRFYKFNRDRGKYTCLACGGSGDSPRSIQHEKWCIINEAIAAIAKAKGDQC